MIQNLFNKGSVPFLENLIHFSAARHKAIANNIANIDTPGYKTIDLPQDDFKRALLEAVEEANEKSVPVLEFEGIDGVRPRPAGGFEPEYSERIDKFSVLKHDGNNVDAEKEVIEMLKNSGIHDTAVSILNMQLAMIRSAISERII